MLLRPLVGGDGSCGPPPGVVGFSFAAESGAASRPADVASLALAAVAAGARHVLLYDAAGACGPAPHAPGCARRPSRRCFSRGTAPAGELERCAQTLAAALAAAAPAAAPGTRLVLGSGRGEGATCVSLPLSPQAEPHARPAALWLLSPRDAAEPVLVRPSRGRAPPPQRDSRPRPPLATTQRLAREGAPAAPPPSPHDVSASAAVCAAEAALSRRHRRSAAPPPPPPVAALFLVGAAPCLAGFPPWLLAGAELYHLGPLAAAARSGGVAAGVRRFTRTAQRLGK